MHSVSLDVGTAEVQADGFEFEFTGIGYPNLSPDEPDGWSRGGEVPPTADNTRVVKNPPLYEPNRCLTQACHLILNEFCTKFFTMSRCLPRAYHQILNEFCTKFFTVSRCLPRAYHQILNSSSTMCSKETLRTAFVVGLPGFRPDD